MKLYLVLIMFFGFSSNAQEYMYPVACVSKKDGALIYLLYQTSVSHLELLLWNSATNVVTKALAAMHTPAGLVMLPDSRGFSFIDNVRIKVKLFNKRSPKSIDLYEPIYAIELITWINEHVFYCSAKEQGYYSLFQGTMQGDLHRLYNKIGCDCLYPQKVDEQLF